MTTSLSLPGRIAQGLTSFGFGFGKAIAARLGRAVLVLVALSLVTSGCANRVQDVLQPLAVAPA
ncbi:hypothetical protein HB770_07015 [Rhizobium leguminosarum bv. viciae]|uniref:Uncharacterized protein n=2 Tax=Rhizobium leguminosarum TaxID=384 RepID=A0A7G6RII9_RHILV|nr:hypothetical protein HB770_07015 [Rhizobium leguminosarum bv. viciae]